VCEGVFLQVFSLKTNKTCVLGVLTLFLLNILIRRSPACSRKILYTGSIPNLNGIYAVLRAKRKKRTSALSNQDGMLCK
jgi:hypothetical protein